MELIRDFTEVHRFGDVKALTCTEETIHTEFVGVGLSAEIGRNFCTNCERRSAERESTHSLKFTIHPAENGKRK